VVQGNEVVSAEVFALATPLSLAQFSAVMRCPNEGVCGGWLCGCVIIRDTVKRIITAAGEVA
jgi:hypothetical protein